MAESNSNDDTTNAHGTVRFAKFIENASGFSYVGDYVPTNCTSSASGTGDCSGASASPDNTTNAAETAECLADCEQSSDTDNSSESGDSVSGNETDNSTPGTLKCLPDCVYKKGTQNSLESGESLAESISGNDTHNSTTEKCKCHSDFISPEDNAEDIAENIHQIIVKLTEFTYNDEKLNGNDLMPLNMELKALQEKGLFTYKMISVINEIVKEKYVKEINWEVYNQMIDALNTFSTIENSAESIITNVIEMKNNQTVKFLTDNKHLTKKVLRGIKEIDEGKDNIQHKLAKLKLIDIPGIVETMKTLKKLGLLSEVLIHKLVNVGKQVAELAREIRFQRIRMKDSVNEVNGSITKRSIKGRDGEDITVVYINCKNDVSSEPQGGGKPADKQSKAKDSICKSEHNTPFCGKCGWRNSWIKSFKKRGIYVKEAPSGSNECIWVNSIKER